MARNKAPISTISQEFPNNTSSIPVDPFAGGLSSHHDVIEYSSFLEREYDEREVMAMCRRLIVWSANPMRDSTNYKMSQFLRQEKICFKTIRRLRDRFPVMDRIYEYAVGILGDHREWMGLTKEWYPPMVMFTMPLYDQDWKDETIRLAKLKTDQNMQQGFTILEKPIYLKCDHEKKTDE